MRSTREKTGERTGERTGAGGESRSEGASKTPVCHEASPDVHGAGSRRAVPAHSRVNRLLYCPNSSTARSPMILMNPSPFEPNRHRRHDRYGRTLGTAFVGHANANLWLVRNTLASHFKGNSNDRPLAGSRWEAQFDLLVVRGDGMGGACGRAEGQACGEWGSEQKC